MRMRHRGPAPASGAGPGRPARRPSGRLGRAPAWSALLPPALLARTVGGRRADHRAGRPLDGAVRTAMEAGFGEPLDTVRVHDGPAARRAAAGLGARAFTVGEDIVLGDVSPGEVASPRGRLVAHEVSHVLQHRRAGRPRADRVEPPCSGAEREAGRAAVLHASGVPPGGGRVVAGGIGRTPVSELVEYDLSYAANDWAVTAAEETRILDHLTNDTDLSATITDLQAAGMVAALFERIDEPGNQRRLLRILGAGLDAAARAIVEPRVRALGRGAELQFNLARHGVTSGAPAFDPTALEAALVGTSRTSRSGTTGGLLTDPFSGVGATGVIPVTRYAGTFLTTPGVPQIPLEDQALLALDDPATIATYSNPLGDLGAYLASLTATQRTQQAELLLRRPIASIEARSYEGDLPSRAQVIEAAAWAHNLHGALVAAFILAEQRDQTQAEDAKDYQGATSIMRGNTSIGLGQVVISTARRGDLFEDLMTADTRARLGVSSMARTGHEATAGLLASDEYNIFAVARYLRRIADQGAGESLAALPDTAAEYPGLDLGLYSGPSTAWPDDNVRALGSEYTSRPWDDLLVPAWGEFVFQAYQDVQATGLL